MVKYTVITDDSESYEFRALLNDDGNYEYPHLAFKVDGELTDLWDKDSYLIETLLPYLKGAMEENHEAFNELEDLFSNTKEGVLELFEEAIKLGFFNETLVKPVENLVVKLQDIEFIPEKPYDSEVISNGNDNLWELPNLGGDVNIEIKIIKD